MYVLASRLISLPVLSLQTGEPVAVTTSLIIGPDTLELTAIQCEVPRPKSRPVVMVNDIRELSPEYLIIDSEDELADPQEIVRVKAMLEQGFTPKGKTVVTDIGRRMGTVEDYTINLESNRVQKLYIRQSLLRSLLGSSLIVDRTQILDITPKQIIVRDTTVKAEVMGHKTAPETHT